MKHKTIWKTQIKCLLKHVSQIMGYSGEIDEFKEVRNAVFNLYVNQST